MEVLEKPKAVLVEVDPLTPNSGKHYQVGYLKLSAKVPLEKRKFVIYFDEGYFRRFRNVQP